MKKIVLNYISYNIDTNKFIDNFKKLSLLAFIYFFPLLTKDIFFYDDFKYFTGLTIGGSSQGRPIADLIISLLNFNISSKTFAHATAIDSSPLYQIMAIMLLILVVSLFCEQVFKEKISWITSITYFSFIASPFYLGMIVFKVDGLI